MIDYTEAVDTLKKIESDYDVMSIKFKGISIWPHLRIYLVNKFFQDKKPQTISGNYKHVLKTLLKYNPLCVFKKHDIWAMFATDDRKKIGRFYLNSVCGYLAELNTNTLLYEKANKAVGHYPTKVIPEKDIISTSWLYLFSFGLERLLRWKVMRIENEDVIKRILADYNVSFDYKFYTRVLFSQHLLGNFLLRIVPRPQLAIIEAPYVYMGYVWSFHKNNIPILELQHGVLNAHHYAYNSIHREDSLMPDEIGVFGIREYQYFTEFNKNYACKVSMIGSYILEKVDEYFNKDIFESQRIKYNNIVVISGQTPTEQILMDFVSEIAHCHQNILFVYIPREKDALISSNYENVKIERGVNIYEYLKWCDIHMTISSTTCLESHYFKKPNIFFDYLKRASTYYADVINEENGAFFINNANEFNDVYNTINNSNFNYLELYAHHSKNNIKKVLTTYLN